MSNSTARGALLRTTMLSTIMATMWCGAAFAQTATTPPANEQIPEAGEASTATEQLQAQAAEGTEVEALVVTGSRIRRNEFTSSSPIQVITKDASTSAGLLTTAEIVQGSTIAQGSEQISGFYNSGVVTDGGAGIKTVSLRGLGANRSLVLLNGRRVSPAGMGGTVGAGTDLNVIPSALVQRVEILKDGASSVYGSDAVAGVANIITRTNLDGWEFDAFGTVPQHRGGESYSLSAAYGQTFDRGSMMFAVQYEKQEALRQGDRDWSKCGHDFLKDPDTGARLDYRDPVTGDLKCVNGTFAGVIQTGLGLGLITPAPGDVAVFGYVPDFHDIYYDPYGTGGVDETPYGSPWDDQQTIVTPYDVFTVTGFATRDLDVFGGSEFYAELLLNRRRSGSLQVGQFFPDVGIEDPRNPLLPIYEDGYPAFYADITPVAPLRYWNKQKVDYARTVLGLRGDYSLGFMNNWSWDASYQYGRSEAVYSGNKMLSDRVANALDVETAPGGGVQCADADARAAGCEPFPLFEASFLVNGEMSPGLYNYVFSNETGTTEFSSHLVNASVTGDLMQLPAGPLAAAFGVEARRDHIDDRPSPGSIAGNLYNYTSSGVTEGSESVYEVFSEISVPLLAKMPFVEELTFDGSARYTKYQNTGYSGTTYKAGLNWAVNSALRLRTTYGTSFRAPALYELFLGGQTSFSSAQDPCFHFEVREPSTALYQNCLSEIGYAGAGTLDDPYFAGYHSTPQVITYGNEGRLDAETSDSFSAGLIWTPSQIDLNVAIDYFIIHVDDEIGKYGATSILGACYSDTRFREPGTLCDFVGERTPYNPVTGAGGDIDEINDSFFNINKQYTAGFDITTRFVQDMSFRNMEIGKFTMDTRTTVTTTDKIVLATGRPTDYNGTFSDPKVVSQLDFKLKRGDWNVFWRANYTSAQSNYHLYAAPNDNPFTSIYDIEIEEMWTHNASIGYEGPDYEVTLGVRNVFDEEPDEVSSAFGRVGSAAYSSQVEPFGRTFFVSLHKVLK